MGFATIWRKRRRLRLPIALQQAFLAKRMSNRLDLWRLLGDLGSNALRRFDAIRYIRSRDFPHAALYILHRIATHLPEPHHQACISAIRSSLRFRGLIPPGPSRPMLAPFFAHSSFRTLLLTQLRRFVRSTTRSALPFHRFQGTPETIQRLVLTPPGSSNLESRRAVLHMYRPRQATPIPPEA